MKMSDGLSSDDEWVLVDTETTGLYPPVYAIEIAAQLFRGLTPIGPAFKVIVNPSVSIPADATAVHGYTDEYVKRNGIPSRDAYELFIKYVAGRRIAAHYARFDWNTVLVPETQRLGLEPWGRLGFCTWSLARRALPENPTHRLDALRACYSLRGSQAHTALGDIEATTDLLTRIIFPRLSVSGFTTIQGIAHFSKLLPLQYCHFVAQGYDEKSALKGVNTMQLAQRERAAKKQQLQEYLDDIEQGRKPLAEVITQHGLIEEHPFITFNGQRFLFTGKLAMGSRAIAQAAVTSRGGLLAKSKAVSNEVDYLVLGAENWQELEHGGKLTTAVSRRIRGLSKPILLMEEAFVAALSE